MNFRDFMLRRQQAALFLFVLALGCAIETAAPVAYETINSPASDHSMQPFLLAEKDTLFMSWTEDLGNGKSSLLMSSFANDHWTGRVDLAHGLDWFVNWADFPGISRSGKNAVAHYLKKSDTATFSYDINYLHSGDGGKNWSEPVKMHTDTMKAEHGFVSFAPLPDEAFAAVWLDGRNTTDHVMQLRSAQIDANGQISHEQLVDHRTCDCCQTSLVNTSQGLLVAYRDRSEEEVRDIYVSMFKDSVWTEPMPVHNDNWVINGCPVNGPKMDAFNESVCLAWFTAADDLPKVNIAFSDDGGLNFNEPLRVDEGRPVGRVDVVMIGPDRAVVSWIESNSTDAEVRLALVDRVKGKISSVEISQVSGARATGFPQLEIFKDQIFMAWNDVHENSSNIKLIRLDLESIYP
jgi:hypothetical protein